MHVNIDVDVVAVVVLHEPEDHDDGAWELKGMTGSIDINVKRRRNDTCILATMYDVWKLHTSHAKSTWQQQRGEIATSFVQCHFSLSHSQGQLNYTVAYSYHYLHRMRLHFYVI